jgi:hypothetical protein
MSLFWWPSPRYKKFPKIFTSMLRSKKYRLTLSQGTISKVSAFIYFFDISSILYAPQATYSFQASYLIATLILFYTIRFIFLISFITFDVCLLMVREFSIYQHIYIRAVAIRPTASYFQALMICCLPYSLLNLLVKPAHFYTYRQRHRTAYPAPATPLIYAYRHLLQSFRLILYLNIATGGNFYSSSKVSTTTPFRFRPTMLRWWHCHTILIISLQDIYFYSRFFDDNFRFSN